MNLSGIPMKSGSKPRSSNIELLRIYAMFFIVWCHLWAGEVAVSGGSFMSHLFANSLGIGAVDIFILITGYFLIRRTEFTLVRFFKILFQVIFYNFVIVAVFVALGSAPPKDLLVCLFPLAPTKFNVWFVSQYLALILLQPFISRLISSLTKTQYRALLCIMLLLTTDFLPAFPLGYMYSGSFKLSWFITLFLVGGYVRIHGIPAIHGGVYALMFVVLSILWSTSYLRGYTQIGYNSLLTLAVSVTLLCVALKTDIGSNKAVNWIASSTFAVYLIHQNYYLSHIIYRYTPDPIDSGFTAVFASGILYMVILFMAMVAIDKVRILIFDLCRVPRFEQWLSDKIISLARKTFAGSTVRSL